MKLAYHLWYKFSTPPWVMGFVQNSKSLSLMEMFSPPEYWIWGVEPGGTSTG